MSCPMVWESPASADATTKTTTADWSINLRPYRSEILPQMGVLTVEARRYAVTTHERWLRPPRSLVMVGRAVETMVWSSAASSRVSMSAASAHPRCVVRGAPGSRGGPAGGVVAGGVAAGAPGSPACGVVPCSVIVPSRRAWSM